MKITIEEMRNYLYPNYIEFLGEEFGDFVTGKTVQEFPEKPGKLVLVLSNGQQFEFEIKEITPTDQEKHK